MKPLVRQLSSGLIVLLVILVLLVVVGRIQGKAAFIVLSGSMEPAYPVGGLVITQPTDFNQLEPGDAITFQSQRDKVVTHRIVEIDYQEKVARTKGDANKTADAQVVLAKDVIGEVRYGLPYIGYGVAFLQSSLGQWLLLMVVVGVLIGYVIRQFFFSKQRPTTVSTLDGRR